MSWYADRLLLPRVKAIVVVAFAALFGVCLWSTLQLELYFDFLSVLPSDSYVGRFYTAANQYTNRQGPKPFIYFRDVDQSDPAIQAEMQAYVDGIVSIDAVSEQPFHWWLRDYQEYVAENELELEGLAFNETIQRFLRDTEHGYGGDFLFDENGNILASRTQFYMDRIDATQLGDGLAAYQEQREVTRAQPVNNQGNDDWAFFSFDKIYQMWEFLLITPHELTQSTLICIGSVSAMSLVFMPHWSGILFVAPLMAVLYIDLMGFINFCGIDINALSYVSLVMAIGLLVDFIMHVVLRYYESPETECREAKTKDVLETMGASVLLGGLSTFLGILPLMFSGSDIIFTFVVTFAGVVILGKSQCMQTTTKVRPFRMLLFALY